MTQPVQNPWTHPSVILVPTDLNELGRLMPFAIEQAVQTGARLLLLHVISTTETVAVDAAGMPYYDPAGAFDFAAKSLEACCTAARARNVVCDGLVREGNPAQQVLAAARQFHVERILLGTRSRGKMSKLLLGSVAEQVLRSVKIPVITVGPEAHLKVDGSDTERLVLHATTLREASRPSAALACQIASSIGARLLLLHILPPAPEMERKGLATGLDSAAMQELKLLASETSAGCGCLPVEPLVIHGNPSIEILAEASARNADLIVLGSTQRSALENLTRDRTVYKVLAHARCPVMTLRELEDKNEQRVIARMAIHG